MGRNIWLTEAPTLWDRKRGGPCKSYFGGPKNLAALMLHSVSCTGMLARFPKSVSTSNLVTLRQTVWVYVSRGPLVAMGSVADPS